MAYYLFFFRWFWVKERPVSQKQFQTKSSTSIARSTLHTWYVDIDIHNAYSGRPGKNQIVRNIDF